LVISWVVSFRTWLPSEQELQPARVDLSPLGQPNVNRFQNNPGNEPDEANQRVLK
jgi:hypothetical protein